MGGDIRIDGFSPNLGIDLTGHIDQVWYETGREKITGIISSLICMYASLNIQHKPAPSLIFIAFFTSSPFRTSLDL